MTKLKKSLKYASITYEAPERVFLNTKIMGINQYINETKAEMKHVTWPTSRQAVAYSLLVILVSVAVAAYLGVLDTVFTAGIKLIIPGF